MTRTGRNEPCPCGSGQKFKKCCGSVTAQESQLEHAPRGTLSAPIERAKLGLPALPIQLFRRAVYHDPNDGRNETFLPGQYSVIFTLSRPGEQLLPDGETADAEMLRGNSYLRFRPSGAPDIQEKEEVEFSVATDDGVFQVREFLNDKGFLAAIQVVSVNANDTYHAEQIARRLIIPSLSHYSTTTDTPLYVCQTDIIELRTEARHVRTIHPFAGIIVSGGRLSVFSLNEEVRVFIALYREALNSNSFLYQFLCFYKIIEGVRTRRERRQAEAVARGETPRNPSERVPSVAAGQIEWLKGMFPGNYAWDEFKLESIFLPELNGKKINSVVENDLRPLRNAIGHAFLEEDNMSLSIDDSDHTDRVHKFLPITKCIARRLLKNEFPDQFP